MNLCCLSGWLCGDAEERVSASKRRFLNFEIVVDSPQRQKIYVRISYFLPAGEDNWSSPNLRAGTKVLVQGSLKFQGVSLFVAANEIAIISAAVCPEHAGIPTKFENAEA
jgi:hypothetical protein